MSYPQQLLDAARRGELHLGAGGQVRVRTSPQMQTPSLLRARRDGAQSHGPRPKKEFFP